MGNYNDHLYQIIETINRLSRKMETLLQGETIATSTGKINNNDDACINKIYEYHDEETGINIFDEEKTEEMRSIIDRINW